MFLTSPPSTSFCDMTKQQCSMTGRPTATVVGRIVRIRTEAKRLLLIFLLHIGPCLPLLRISVTRSPAKQEGALPHSIDIEQTS